MCGFLPCGLFTMWIFDCGLTVWFLPYGFHDHVVFLPCGFDHAALCTHEKSNSGFCVIELIAFTIIRLICRKETLCRLFQNQSERCSCVPVWLKINNNKIEQQHSSLRDGL